MPHRPSVNVLISPWAIANFGTHVIFGVVITDAAPNPGAATMPTNALKEPGWAVRRSVAVAILRS